ncbi:MAG: copper-binding protein [Phenylobacterium sp.]|nr:MAG: copper-binding protein [Phenylobacterium sp.]
MIRLLRSSATSASSLKWTAPILLATLMAASPAFSQYGRGTSGRPGQGRPPPASRGPSRPSTHVRSPPPPPQAPFKMSDVVGVGVVQAVDAAGGRVTIAYEAIESLNWPHGTKPFAVAKSSLLAGVAPGDKVRFRLESQQIADLRLIAPRPAAGPDAPASGSVDPASAAVAAPRPPP